MPGPRILVCGSIAFDTIMVFADRFRRHILPDQAHILNISFAVNELRREWGGCGGNIAYTLRMLGGEPVVMGTLGDDGAAYRERLEGLGIGTRHVRHVEGTYTAQAFITTDLDDNQITAFHPGAMNFSHLNRAEEASDIALAIVSPDGRQGMVEHAEQLARAGIPFVFDPGQAMPLFEGPELVELVDRATYVTVNDYEARLLVERTGLPIETLARRVRALVVTLGAQGSRIHAGGDVIDIPAVRPKAEVDPTGCGDAYRAGLLLGIASGWDWTTTGRLASLLGSVKMASRGAQNHRVTREEIGARYLEAFGSRLW